MYKVAVGDSAYMIAPAPRYQKEANSCCLFELVVIYTALGVNGSKMSHEAAIQLSAFARKFSKGIQITRRIVFATDK